MLSSKISSHRRRPVPMAAMDPGLRREDEKEDAEPRDQDPLAGSTRSASLVFRRFALKAGIA
jgi:hypothetical protein